MSGCLGKNTDKGTIPHGAGNNTGEVTFARRENIIEASPGKTSSGLEIK